MPSPREQPNPPNRQRRRKDPSPGSWPWMIVLGIFVLVILSLVYNVKEPGTIDFSKFMDLAREKSFTKVVLRGDKMIGEFQPGQLEKLPAGEETDTLKKRVANNRVATQFDPKATDQVYKELHLDYKVPLSFEDPPENYFRPVFFFLLPTILIIAFIFFFLLPRMRDPMGGGFLGNYIKSPARRYEKAKMRITFNDVAGMQAAKSELQEIVEFLKGPEKFQRLGAQIPKGVLLIGPPGTGKTLLARAVAGEAGVPFFSISGSEFIQMFVGVGASRVRDMFKTAKDNAPCLLFIDEIDAVGRMRGAGVGGGSDEREQTLNQILNEMDGFTPTESVIVIAATNRPDVLDSALLRPGRFDRHVTIDRPTWQGRFEILKVHTRNKPLAENVNLEEIARKMIGMTGADLRNLANEAAILATRENKQRIERDDFEKAADRVLMGPRREEVLNEESKKQVAYHEAGHTLVGWLQPEIDPPKKVTVVPRGRAGGVTFYGFDEDRMHYGLDYFKAELTMMMGGRAAERLVYGQLFAGAESDLKQATRRARYMVTHWGMSEKLGPMSFRVGEEHVFLGKEIQEQRDFSEATMATIDAEVQKLLREADARALELLKNHQGQLDRLVDALMIKEELFEEEIAEVLGKHPRQTGIVAGPAPQLPRTAAGAATGVSANGDVSS